MLKFAAKQTVKRVIELDLVAIPTSTVAQPCPRTAARKAVIARVTISLSRQAADHRISPHIAHDVRWHLQRDRHRWCDQRHRMADRLRFLKVAVRLASRQAKLARQRHNRFRHADPTRQQAVRSVQPLGLLSIGRSRHVTYAYYPLRRKSSTDPNRHCPNLALKPKVTFCVQGVVSPILANLFLHYAFDLWVTRHLPGVRFARYADDAVLHCKSRRQAEYVLDRIRERFQACKLELHPGKTRIVYCKDINRTGDHPDIQFTFLGYTFRPRKAVDKYGRVYVNFSPAVSRDALKAMRQTIRGWHLQLKSDKSLADLSAMFAPILRGWQQYYGRFHGSALKPVWRKHEPVPDPMADAQAQEAGGP